MVKIGSLSYEYISIIFYGVVSAYFNVLTERMCSRMIIKGTVLLEFFTTEFALIWPFSFVIKSYKQNEKPKFALLKFLSIGLTTTTYQPPNLYGFVNAVSNYLT